MREMFEFKIVDSEDLVYRPSFTGERWAVELVEHQQGALGEPGSDGFQHIFGRLVDVHVEYRHPDNGRGIVDQPLLYGGGCVSLDEFKFLFVRYRTKAFVDTK